MEIFRPPMNHPLTPSLSPNGGTAIGLRARAGLLILILLVIVICKMLWRLRLRVRLGLRTLRLGRQPELNSTAVPNGGEGRKFWLDYFKRTHSDAACLSAGGCVAYYPTEVPLHHRSRFLGDRDPFGELVRGCRQLGMVVLARTDPHRSEEPTSELQSPCNLVCRL